MATNKKKINESEDNNVFSDLSHKGETLMLQALKKLKEGDTEGFLSDKKMADHYFDQWIDEVGRHSLNYQELYNESLNFGIIYNVIEENVNKLLQTKKGQKSLRRIVKTIKNDKVLQEQFNAYNNFQPSKPIANTDKYITEALAITPKFNLKKVYASNKKLIDILTEEKIDQLVYIPEEKIELYEAIEEVAIKPKKLENVDTLTASENVIKEHLSNIKNNDSSLTVKDLDESITSSADMLADELTDAEFKLIKKLTNENINKETEFKATQKDVLNNVQRLIESEENLEVKSRLQAVYEKVKNKTYNENTLIEDIARFLEIKETILED